MPLRSLLTIASSDDSTIAASLSVGSGGRMVIRSERSSLSPVVQDVYTPGRL